MSSSDDYLAVNRANWDERAPAHAASPGYSYSSMVTNPDQLSGVVEFDRDRLGDIAGLRAVHLQCHIGTDTLSLHRLGARVTGLDFSPASIDQARALASAAGAEIDYVCAAVYDALTVLPTAEFDLVYTGVGALCWLPDVRRWAEVVSGLLRPGGRLFVREGHPMLWAIDETQPDGLRVDYPYFETPNPLDLTEEGSYVETDVSFVHNRTLTWNHGLAETITALQGAGLDFVSLDEHRSVPWCALPGHMTEDPNGEWRLSDRPERLPLSYTLQARKR